MHTIPGTATAPGPYRAALRWIEGEGYGTGSAVRLAKCVLSLYNAEDHPWGMADILGGLDSRLSALVLAMVRDYAEHGETAELIEVGKRVWHLEPGLVEVGQAMMQARRDVRRRWDREREEEAAREQERADQRERERERERAEGREPESVKPAPLRNPPSPRIRG